MSENPKGVFLLIPHSLYTSLRTLKLLLPDIRMLEEAKNMHRLMLGLVSLDYLKIRPDSNFLSEDVNMMMQIWTWIHCQ